MNRNVESHFATNPTNIDIQRSRFDRSSSHKTTFNAGDLVPFFVDEVLPGDTFDSVTSVLVRMNTPVFPVIDNCYLDTYYFFVPNRLVWDHWKEFNGENTSTYWTQPIDYEIPQVSAPEETGWTKGDLADYMGIPINQDIGSVNALFFRAYVLIWNEWFRDQNLMNPAYFYKGDDTITGATHLDEVQPDALRGGALLKVSKYHDYFTSCLPAPQKNDPVRFPLAGDLPVVARSEPHDSYISGQGIQFQAGTILSENQTFYRPFFASLDPTDPTNQDAKLVIEKSGITPPSGSNIFNATPTNLYADLEDATAITVNQLRQAFAVQRLYERDARGGTRYTELLKSHFGVTSPDQRQQRPEYLGGTRIPINIDQVLQTSSTDETSPQGNTAAFSLTTDVGSSYIKSFTEHGIILGLCCVRTDHTYQQGLERMWSRKNRFDYYWPSLANIGEMAVLRKEIYAIGDSDAATGDDSVFGYQEAWADYRYKPNRVSGALRSTNSPNLDVWHYADHYTSTPFLSDEWMYETAANIDRTLAVPSSTEDQFIADFYIKNLCTRAMPLYSIPGLIDHH